MMTKSTQTNRLAKRKSISATQHERLAYASAEFADRQINHFSQLVSLIRYVGRDRPITRDDWREQFNALVLALETAERFQLEAEGEKVFFEIVHRDVRGIKTPETSGKNAIDVLVEAAQPVTDDQCPESNVKRSATARSIRGRQHVVAQY